MMNRYSKPSRRNLLRGIVGVGGAASLGSLVTGLPRSFFQTGSLAHAAEPGEQDYLILASSAQGEPLNANAPGTYVDGTEHNPSADLVETELTLGDSTTTAAKPWADLSADLRARMAFIHHQTYTFAHPEMYKVLGAHGAVTALDSNVGDQLPAVLAPLIAECLGTVQAEPVPLGDVTLGFQGRPLDLVRPTELQGLFGEAEDLEATLQAMRDQTLDAVYGELRDSGTAAQRAFLDRYALGREQARQIGVELGELLTRVPVDAADVNGGRDQVIAAAALLRLNIAPIVSITIPFGGDNHGDTGLTAEAGQTVSGCATLQLLWDELVAAQIQDRTTFATLDVFGRTLRRASSGGRDHNGDHHAMCLFGPRVRGGVAGGIEDNGRDFQATGIDRASGASTEGGDIPAEQTLESAFRTLAAATGLASETLDPALIGGQVIDSVIL